jgi:DNA gyrase subunit B
MNDSYTAESIKVLKGRDAVRKRPGMYIGDVDDISGLHHMVWEVVDNAVDEAQAGFASNIEVVIHADQTVTVIDDGRGIPTDMHKESGRSAAEVIMTELHAGGKFDSNSYKVSGGLHGVGVSVVNFLAEWLRLEVHRDGKVWEQEFARGVPTEPLKAIGTTRKTGTIVSFKPDSEIFSVLEFHPDLLVRHLRELAFLNSGLTMAFSDEATEREEVFLFDGGLREFVRYLNRSKNTLHEEPIYLTDSNEDGEQIEVALQWHDGYNENVLAFTNTVFNRDGGTHLSGFRAALTRTVNTYANAQGFLKESEENLSGEDRRAHQRTAILEPDQGQARVVGHQGLGRVSHQRTPRDPPRGESGGRQEGGGEMPRRRTGARSGAQGARADSPQERPGEFLPTWQARRLLGERPGTFRALHRRRRLGRGLRETGPRPPIPSDSPPAGKDPQR